LGSSLKEIFREKIVALKRLLSIAKPNRIRLEVLLLGSLR
jgi:hypothetical protein